MQLTSSAYTNQGLIPAEYASVGKDSNPPLTIAQAPAGTVAFALVMHDPDAVQGDYLHWVIWNIPANITTIAEGEVPQGAVVGINDAQNFGYARPMPPAGSGTHRYTFELYALNAMLDVPQNANRAAIETAINAHTIQKAQLVGLYGR